MPAKDAKKKGPTKPVCALPEVVEPVTDASPEYYLLKISDLEFAVKRYQEKLKEVTTRNEVLNAQLKQAFTVRNKEIKSRDWTLNRRVEEVQDLQQNIKRRETTLQQDRIDCEQTLKRIAQEKATFEESMRVKNKINAEKIAMLEEFKPLKPVLLKKIEEMEKNLELMMKVHEEEMEELEDKLIQGKNKLKDDIMTRLSLVAQQYQHHARISMPPMVFRVLFENFVMNNRVRSLNGETKDIIYDNGELIEEKGALLDNIRLNRRAEACLVEKNLANKELIKLLEVHERKLTDKLATFRQDKQPSLDEKVAAKQQQLEANREQLRLSHQTNSDLSLMLCKVKSELTARLVIQWRFEKTLKSLAKELNAAMQPDIDPECNDQEHTTEHRMPRPKILKCFMQVLDTACRLHIGPTLTNILSPNDDVISKNEELSYQPGELGFIPRRGQVLQTNFDLMKRVTAANRRQTQEFVHHKPLVRTRQTSLVQARTLSANGDQQQQKVVCAQEVFRKLFTERHEA